MRLPAVHKTLAIMLIAVCLCVSAGDADATDTIAFQGYDPLWQDTFTLVKRHGEYLVDGAAMEELRHPNMPPDGLSLAMKDRIGRPDLYYLVLPKKLDIYVNCEFGSCPFQRSLIGTCCQDL